MGSCLDIYVFMVHLAVGRILTETAGQHCCYDMKNMEFPPEYKIWEFFEHNLCPTQCAMEWVRYKYLH